MNGDKMNKPTGEAWYENVLTFLGLTAAPGLVIFGVFGVMKLFSGHDVGKMPMVIMALLGGVGLFVRAIRSIRRRLNRRRLIVGRLSDEQRRKY